MEKEIKTNATDRVQPLNVPAFKQREKSGGLIPLRSLRLHKFYCTISILNPHPNQVIELIRYHVREGVVIE
jgi:hypothetical protein